MGMNLGILWIRGRSIVTGWLLVATFVFGVPMSATTCAAEPAATVDRPVFDLARLHAVPETFPAEGFEVGPEGSERIRPLFFAGPEWQGKPTRVFAWYGVPEITPGTKVPAMVLVHGGGGTAFERWVKVWNDRGYAAIAVDLCGCVPKGTYGQWERHDAGGPPGWDASFDQLDWPAEDQWPHQAVSAIVLAHSLMRSFPEVDADRIGVTGISWGGYLTSFVAGVDDRFRLAVPVYGCGFLEENSVWLPQFARIGPEKAARWTAWWDPRAWLGGAEMPMLWMNGTNDFAYPPDSWQKSYRLPKGPRTLSMPVRMPHGHGPAGESPEEIRAFADSILNHGSPLARVTAHGHERGEAWVTYETDQPLAKVELNFTTGDGPWQDRLWETVPAEVDVEQGEARAEVPEGTTAWYFNLVDGRGLIVSSEHDTH
jgi:dienelactone hydrolase